MYSFQNDHIVRGPLCRLIGLIDLLQREEMSKDGQKILGMLLFEVRQMENVTLMISAALGDYENKLEELIDGFNYEIYPNANDENNTDKYHHIAVHDEQYVGRANG